jgi:hypothetical protein
MAPENIASAIEDRGVDALQAKRHVDVALTDWDRLGLIVPRPPSVPTSFPGPIGQVIALPDLVVRIVYPAACGVPVARVFRHLEAGSEDVDILLQWIECGDRVHLFRNGDWILSCSPDELPIMLKGQLLTEVLERGTYELALHAAALGRDDRILILSGDPGAGKTTLTLALVHAGFGFVADDVTLLDSTGRAVGLPFAPSVKAGAWSILAEYCPDLAVAPIFRRPDRRRVRYPVVKEFVPPSPRPIGWVVVLRRGAGAKARLEPIDPAGALRGLLNGAFARGGEMTDAAFDVLARVVGLAEVYALTYSNLEDAVALIRRTGR